MSPVNGRIDMDLGQLLNSISDPFSTKKQLCRTPESLIKDGRSSWRKAVEEGVAEKKQTSWVGQDSLSWLKTPLAEAELNRPSPEPSLIFDTTHQCTPPPPPPPPVQQGSALHSTLSWDSSQLEALNSQSSSDIKFSIAHEELPELFEDEVSFNSDGSMEIQGSRGIDKEFVLLPVLSHSPDGESPLQRTTKASFKDLCIESNFMSPELLKKSPGLNLWAGDETLFSLELDKLESASPPPPEKLSLPSLVNVNLDEF